MAVSDRIPALIAVDWGTTRLRVRLVDARGHVLATAESSDGIGQLDGGHEQAFSRLVAEWPRLPAIMTGMVGSRQGWHEAAYVPCPATEASIAERILRFETSDGRPAAIIPGLSLDVPSRDGDVMRGEETQMIGLIVREPGFRGVAICPGTHSKWTRIADGTIEEFQTILTGDMFAIMQQKSFLRHSVAQDTAAVGDLTERPDFALGVERTAREGLPYLNAIFSVRVRSLLGSVTKEDNLAYLSGISIGSEIAAALTVDPISPGTPIRIIATSRLARAYGAALAQVGYASDILDGDELALAGMVRLAQAIDFLPAEIAS